MTRQSETIMAALRAPTTHPIPHLMSPPHEHRLLSYSCVVKMGELYEAQHLKLYEHEQNRECGLGALQAAGGKKSIGQKVSFLPHSV